MFHYACEVTTAMLSYGISKYNNHVIHLISVTPHQPKAPTSFGPTEYSDTLPAIDPKKAQDAY
jgi:hypothetical protein